MRKKIFVILLIVIFFGINITVCQYNSKILFASELDEPTEMEVIKVTDIDIADYSSEMYVGTTQQIQAIVIPENATNQIVTFSSSNELIATVNEVGRIKAVSPGAVIIYVSAEEVVYELYINVINKNTITDIDFEYEDTMKVGNTQTIYPQILPTGAEYECMYSSSDENVLTINNFGKIHAEAPGSAEITVSVGNISKTVKIYVELEQHAVSIELSEYKEKMKVGDKQSLSATIFPANSIEQNLYYQSSDSSVISVSEGGQLHAISAGKVMITIYTGGVSKEIEIESYVPTKKIVVENSYINLNVGDSYELKAEVFPKDADQNLKYKSTNIEIATVDKNGKILAKSSGQTSVIMSNEDYIENVTVIVKNSTNNTDNMEQTHQPLDDESEKDSIIDKINSTKNEDILSVSGYEYPTVTSEMLEALYKNKVKLYVNYKEYTIIICGNKIKNIENELITLIVYEEKNGKMHLTINEGNSLPGEIEIIFNGIDEKYKYLYLYNPVKKHYEKLKAYTGNTMTISSNGYYILSETKMVDNQVTIILVFIALAVVLIVIVLYILTYKKYLFW